MRLLVIITTFSLLLGGCQPAVKLRDLYTLSPTERDEAESNWDRVEKAFKAKDQRALEALIGCRVLITVESSVSPWTGKALSLEERAASARDSDRLSAATGERATQIATEVRERRDKARHVNCKIDFTRKQVRQHFIWPDAVFASEFGLLATLTEASISDHSIRVKPIAIQPAIFQL